MGIYFIAAGNFSKNREKSLDKSFGKNQLQGFLRTEDFAKLEEHFPSGKRVYMWGANGGKSFNQLKNVSSGEYVVDVKNSEVVQVFEFCFYMNTGGNTRLQDYIGWDREKPREKRRPFKYVFFLKNPRPPSSDQKEKEYFQSAFDKNANQQWLIGQRWFSGSQVSLACQRKNVANIEELIWGGSF